MREMRDSEGANMISLVSELRAAALPGTHVGDCMMRAADEIEMLRRRVESQGQVIRAIGGHAREADRTFAAWVQNEWEREHAQTGERD